MAEMRTFTLMNAQPRVVTPRDPNKQTFTLYELFDDQGGKWVVRQDVFNHALPMLGQRVSAVCRIEQRDQYTNFFIDSLELAGNGYVQQAQQAQPQPQPQQQVVRQTVAPDERERQRSIHRQVAAKVAAAIVQAASADGTAQSADSFWGNVSALYHYFETGQVPNAIGGYSQPQTQQTVRQNAAAYAPYEHTDPGPQSDQYASQAQGDEVPF